MIQIKIAMSFWSPHYPKLDAELIFNCDPKRNRSRRRQNDVALNVIKRTEQNFTHSKWDKWPRKNNNDRWIRIDCLTNCKIKQSTQFYHYGNQSNLLSIVFTFDILTTELFYYVLFLFSKYCINQCVHVSHFQIYYAGAYLFKYQTLEWKQKQCTHFTISSK